MVLAVCVLVCERPFSSSQDAFRDVLFRLYVVDGTHCACIPSRVSIAWAFVSYFFRPEWDGYLWYGGLYVTYNKRFTSHFLSLFCWAAVRILSVHFVDFLSGILCCRIEISFNLCTLIGIIWLDLKRVPYYRQTLKTIFIHMKFSFMLISLNWMASQMRKRWQWKCYRPIYSWVMHQTNTVHSIENVHYGAVAEMTWLVQSRAFKCCMKWKTRFTDIPVCIYLVLCVGLRHNFFFFTTDTFAMIISGSCNINTSSYGRCIWG